MRIYPSFFNKDDLLRSFLDTGGALHLLKVKNMEEHRRALNSIDLELENIPIESKSIQLLKAENIAEFNRLRQQTNLAYLMLPDIDLAKKDLHGVCLANANLSGASLIGSDLSTTDLTGSFFTKALLVNANLSRANLYEVYMHRSDLRQANLQSATLAAANLSAADLREARFDGADLKNSNLNGSNMEKADFRFAKNLPISASEAGKRSLGLDKPRLTLVVGRNTIHYS